MKRFLIFAVAVCTTLTSFGWGQKGHDTVAYIAECNLTPEVYQKVVKRLGGHSLVYYANWLDNASYSDQYRYTKTWHYANVDEGFTYDTMAKNEKGDVVTAIDGLIAELKSGKLSAEQENIRLRMLIHLMGDIHCPMHAGHLGDKVALVVGHSACRGGSQVELHRVGAAAQSLLHSGGEGRNRKGRSKGLAERKPHHRYRNLQGIACEGQPFVRLHRILCSRHRAATLGRRYQIGKNTKRII